MFAIPSIALLVVFMIVRPQEFIPLLQRVPFLYLFTAFAALGYIIDVRLRRLQPWASNAFPWILAFVLWAILSIVVNAPDQLVARAIELGMLFAFYGVLAHGIQRFRTFQLVAGVVAASCMFVSVVCIHQGVSPMQCIGGAEKDGDVDGEPDGRACETNVDCRGPTDSEPDLEYRCERVGLFGTYSVEGRVRYRGALKDPNEVALTISAGAIALLAGFMLRKKRSVRRVLSTVGVVLAVVTVFMTQSRGGLVAAMIVPAVYLIRRHGVGVLIPSAIVAIPILILGGRSGEAADVSTEMRYEAWAKGLDLWHHNPILGVGQRQFGQHHWLTAHNSFVLTLAELGIVGMVLFTAIIYLCIKTLLVGMRAISTIPEARTAEIWGMALLAAIVSILFQINTLSFAYHQVLWLFFGLVGAWYSAVRYHLPELSIKLTLQDLVIVTVSCLLYALVVMPLFLMSKGEM